ncbi:unnamed protein product [Adineta ricciae]|uniref:Uncharacterized protein n=1 Tax=Adineta ricciae TaxID=249248 RepID=A0A814J1T2_ADIRI|nr:unnamed protein product [Adineta ricciae]
MSTDPSSTQQRLDFAPLHRTVELENIHAQVTQNDLNVQQQEPRQSAQKPTSPSTRKVLARHITVIGDGSDTDHNQLMA